MFFKLPELEYEFGALEPHLDGRTMEIHVTKHHQGYIDKLNATLEKHKDLQDKTLEEMITNLDALPADAVTSVKNNGGGHYNHSFFWTNMTGSESAGAAPTGAIADKINEQYGSYENFKGEFSAAATGVFGSGWAWLSKDAEGKLVISQSSDHENPLMEGKTPLMTLDVWEHAYYLGYQNRRPDYVAAFWNVVDWQQVGKYFEGKELKLEKEN